MTMFQHGDRIRLETVGDDGLPLVRYGFVGDIDDECERIAVMLDGVGNAVTEDNGDADTTIKVAWSDWQDMTQGKLDGMTAFMQGKLQVEGDMSNAMQLQGVLAKLKG